MLPISVQSLWPHSGQGVSILLCCHAGNPMAMPHKVRGLTHFGPILSDTVQEGLQNTAICGMTAATWCPLLLPFPHISPQRGHQAPSPQRYHRVFLTQPSFKQALQALTTLHVECLSHPQYEHYHHDYYSYHQQVAKREPRTAVTAHASTFSIVRLASSTLSATTMIRRSGDCFSARLRRENKTRLHRIMMGAI